MLQSQRSTFREIVAREAAHNARALAQKADQADSLAKACPGQGQVLYRVRDQAVRQLFRIPGFGPEILAGWITADGILLCLGLAGTRYLLHASLDGLEPVTQAQIAERTARLADSKRRIPGLWRLLAPRFRQRPYGWSPGHGLGQPWGGQ